MHTVSTVQCEEVCFSGGHLADPVMSQLREWHQLANSNGMHGTHLFNAIHII